MYNSLKAQITFGTFNVLDMQRRTQKIYAMGGLTEEQLDELYSLIAQKANPETERPETLKLIQTLFEQLGLLADRVKALESGNSEGGTDEGDTEEYPDWEPWNGLSNQYQPGAIVNHNDQLWQSVYNGQNVWEPGVVDERFWIHYTPEE